MDLIKVVNEAFATKKEFPAFKSGDTITVAYRIKEGNRRLLFPTLPVVRTLNPSRCRENLSEPIPQWPSHSRVCCMRKRQ